MRIELEHCVLRSWRKGDQKALVRYANNRKIWLNVRDMFPFPYTRRDADQWIRHATALTALLKWTAKPWVVWA